MIDNENVIVRRKDGDSIVKLQPKFSDNGQYIIVNSAEAISSYNTETGRKYIKYEGMRKPIIGFGIALIDEIEHLVACGQDGAVIIWKLSDGFKMKQMEIKRQNLTNFIVRKGTNSAYALSNCNFKLQISTLNLSTGQSKCLNVNLPKVGHGFLFDIGGPLNDQHFVVTDKRKIHFVKLINQESKMLTKTIQNDFTCVACNSVNDCVLTGCSDGCVFLWQNIAQNPTMSKYHWHTLPVRTVQFSGMGNIFYSGGEECVVVKWRMDNPLEKDFLPRLSSTIVQLAVPLDNACVAIGTTDNAIHLADAQMRSIVNTIQHLVKAENYTAGIVFDPRTKCLVTNGTVGHLQFYSPQDSNLLFNFDVVVANRMTNEKHAKMVNMDVSLVAMSRSGLWMATMEDREDDYCRYSTYEARLKFWKFNQNNQKYELNTFVNYPHKAKVFDVKFQPMMNESKLRCVTIGDDKYFRVWQLEEKETGLFAWRCVSAAFYKERIPRKMAFSFDGSLLAISFEHVLTTWLPDSCELKCSLSHPIYSKASDVIMGVAFGTGQQCHLLVHACKERLNVWNLLTLSMMWTVPLQIEHFVSEMRCPYMAVFTKNFNLYIFNPASSTPIYLRKNNVSILTAALVPNTFVHTPGSKWYHNTKLYYINKSKQLYCLEGKDEELIETIQFVHEESSSPIFGKLPLQIKPSVMEHYKPVMHTYLKSDHRKKMSDLLDSPAHTMAPIRLLCYSILNTMVLKEQNVAASDGSAQIVKENEILYGNEEKKSNDQNNDDMFDEEDLTKISAEKITKHVIAAFV